MGDWVMGDKIVQRGSNNIGKICGDAPIDNRTQEAARSAASELAPLLASLRAEGYVLNNSVVDVAAVEDRILSWPGSLSAVCAAVAAGAAEALMTILNDPVASFVIAAIGRLIL